MRAPILFLATVVASASALAQPAGAPESAVPPPVTASGNPAQENSAAPSRQNQRIERIREEDAGSRVDELRVGGQTQSINVQPKGGKMPSYEVKPGNAGKDGINQSGSDGTNGRRVWNLKF